MARHILLNIFGFFVAAFKQDVIFNPQSIKQADVQVNFRYTVYRVMAARIQRLSGILEGLKKGNEVNIETEALRTKFSKNKLQVAAGNANDANISDLFEGSERGDLDLCLKRVQNAPFTSYKFCVDCAFIVVSPFFVWLSFQRCFYASILSALIFTLAV